MVRQLSVSASDAVLALATFHCSWTVVSLNICGFIGFTLVGCAATCGVYRFGSSNASQDVIKIHKYLSWLASVIGMSFLAAAFYRLGDVSVLANAHVSAAFAVLLLRTVLSDKISAVITEVISGCAIISIFAFSIWHFNPYGLTGAILYIVAGLFVKTDGDLLGFQRVNVFHYLVAFANLLLMLGLTEVSTPVYYRPSVMGA